MLKIAGGIYFERCFEPARNELYGSGLRAAAAVSHIVKVQLHGYVAADDVGHLTANAGSYGISHSAAMTERTILFTYLHSLARPSITPSVGHIIQSEQIQVSGSAVLRFGMLEGTAVVDGGRVVYDPQSPFDPRCFGENGSRAKELAIVSNRRESSLLAKRTEADKIAKQLMAVEGASVVVIKGGPHGALVYADGNRSEVPAYRTDRVWKIGSGDVFAATFAAFWAERRMDAVEATKRASAAAAMYCGSQAIPLSKNFYETAIKTLKTIQIKKRPNRGQPVVYLAGPFFTMPERWLVTEAREALLQLGVRVFSPFHDVGHGSAEDVVPADLKALDESDAVFAIVDGIDAGTLFEVGYAKARGTPVVAFAQNTSEEDLKMLDGSHCRVSDDFASAIYNTVWAALTGI